MTPDQTTYTIRQVSEQFQLPMSTLRYYEDVGLLKDVPRKGQQRAYETQHLNRIHAINCFKHTGMTIQQIQQFFYYEDETQDYDALVGMLRAQCAALEEQLTLLLDNQAHLKNKLKHYQEKKIAFEEGQKIRS
ncbi:MerR family transcriptional regulator [Enterococcus asini]|uniref:MerR family transcriptional regulator n=1 Tax=Enterococcus asini TaxID=57732 RepID=UPI00288F515B|nr:MerR family transcriptional regulator [Enterococcus asini]MDT2757246.1 MerR family transcriptional regulator [Enterococcus asini]